MNHFRLDEFAVHLLYLHNTEYEQKDNRPGLSNMLWAQYLLESGETIVAPEVSDGLSSKLVEPERRITVICQAKHELHHSNIDATSFRASDICIC